MFVSQERTPSVCVTGTAPTGVQIINNYIHDDRGAGVLYGNASFLRVAGNTLTRIGANDAAISAGGTNSNILIENNTISLVSDYIYPLGTKYVIRNNTVGPSNPTATVHIDFVQMTGNANFGLVEGNVSIGNFSSDNHVFLDQCTQSTNWILRENAVSKGSGGFLLRAANKISLYNNTIYDTESYNDSTFQVYIDNGLQCGDPGNSSLLSRNNIWDHSVRANGTVYLINTPGSSLDKDYDLWFNSGSPLETHAHECRSSIRKCCQRRFSPDKVVTSPKVRWTADNG